MAQNDELKIILEAELQDGSLEAIEKKLKVLKESIKDLEIKIILKDDSNFNAHLQNLAKNLELFNSQLSKLTDEQAENLRQIAEQAQKNAKIIEEMQRKEIQGNKELLESEENLIKTRTKFKGTTPDKETKTYSDGFKKTQQTKDLETGEISTVIEKENKKIRDRVKEREELIKDFRVQKNKFAKVLKEFEEQGVNTNPQGIAGKFKKNLEQWNMEDIFGNADDTAIDFQKRYKQVLDETTESYKKSMMWLENLNRLEKERKEIFARRDALKTEGYDVTELNKLITANLQYRKETKELESGINDVKKALSGMESHADKMNNLLKATDQIGLKIRKTFQNLSATEEVTELKNELTELQAKLNAGREAGTLKGTHQEIKYVEELIAKLQEEIALKQLSAKQKNFRKEKLDEAELLIPKQARTEEQKRFVELRKSLETTEDFYNVSQELNRLASEIIGKEKLRADILKQQRDLQADLAGFAKRGTNDTVVTGDFESSIKDIDPSKLIKPNESLAEAQERYNRALDESKRKLSESLEYEKNYELVNEKRVALKEREARLSKLGYDTSGIREMIDQNLNYNQTNKEVRKNLSGISDELKKLEDSYNESVKLNKQFETLNHTIDKLGISLKKSFRNLDSPEDLQELSDELKQIQEKLASQKGKGIEIDENEIADAQELLRIFKNQVDLRKLEAQENKENIARIEKLNKQYDALNNKTELLSVNIKDAFRGLDAEDDVEYLNKELDKMVRTLKLIDNQKKRGEEIDQTLLDNANKINDRINQQLKIRKSQAKSLQSDVKTVEDYAESIEKLESTTRQMTLNLNKGFKNLNAEGKQQELFEQILKLQSQIAKAKELDAENGRKVTEEINKQVNALKTRIQEEKLIAQAENERIRAEKSLRGDVVTNTDFGADRINQIYSQNESNLDREKQLRELAKAYLEVNHGVTGLNTAHARFSENLDKANKRISTITYEARDATGEIKKYTVGVHEATGAMRYMGEQARSLRNELTFMQHLSLSFKRVPAYLASFGLVYEAWAQIVQSFQKLYEIDEAMTNLAKVTDATTSEFEAFRTEASIMAQELGSTTAEVAQAVTEFQKLGYTFQQSKGLGETALVYANVGDMSIEDATGAMISSLKGFGVAQEDIIKESERYLDIFNEVGNNYAVTSAGIGEAMKRASASLHEAGNSVEESVAMIASANAVIQDERKVGTALKTISMRLRGVDEETGSLLGVMPELDETFKSIGITLMDETTGAFKTTYEIMNELAQIWNTGVIHDMQKANLVEAIGGKHHGTVVSAMLNNWADATGSYETALTSAGSASREFEKYQDSLVYRVDRLKASFEQFWLTFWDDDSVKNAVDGLTALINKITALVDTVGSVPLIGSTMLSGVFLLNENLRKTFITSTIHAEKFTSKTDKAKQSVIELGSVAGKAVKSLGKLFLVGFGGFIFSTILTEITGKIYDLITAQDQLIDKLQERYEKQEQINQQFADIDLDRYAVLEYNKNQGKIDTEELQEFTKLQDQLKASSADVISHYDEQGNAVLKTADALKKMNEQSKEELELSRQRLIMEQEKQVTGDNFKTKAMRVFALGQYDEFAEAGVMGYGTPVQKLERDAEQLRKTKDEFNAISKELQQINLLDSIINKKDLQGLTNDRAKLTTELNAIKKIIEDARNQGNLSLKQSSQLNYALDLFGQTGDYSQFRENISNITNELNESLDKLDEELLDAEEKVGTSLSGVEELLEHKFNSFMSKNDIDFKSNAGEIAKDLKEAYEKAISENTVDDVEKAIIDFEKDLQIVFDSIENSGIDFSDFATGTDEAIGALEKVQKEMDGTINIIPFLIQYLESLKNKEDEVTASHTKMNETIADTRNIISEYQKNTEILSSVMQSVNNEQALTLDQVDELIAVYPQLSDDLTTHNGVLSVQKDALLAVAEEQENLTKEALKNNKDKMESDLAQVKAFLKGADAELKAIQAMEEAYRKRGLRTNHEFAKATAMQEVVNINKKALEGGAPPLSPEVTKKYIDHRTASLQKVLDSNDEAISLQNEINKINALLNSNWTQNYVNPPKKDNDKDKKDTREMIYITDRYKETIRKLNEQILKQQEIMNNFPTYSKEYQTALKEEMRLIQEKIKANDAEAKSLQKQVDAKNVQKKGLVEKGKSGAGGTVHSVRSGETLSGIGAKYGVNWRELAKQNNISNPNRISVGQKISIGGGGTGADARNAQAEMQQAIDQAKDEILNIQQNSAQLRQEIQTKMMSLIEAEIARTDREAMKLEDDLLYNEYIGNKLDTQSNEYKQNRKERLRILTTQAEANAEGIQYLEKEIATAENILNDKMSDAIYDMLDEQRKKYIQQQQAIYDLQEEIAQAVIDDIISGYEKNIELTDRQISDIERKANRLAETDLGTYVKYQLDIADVIRQQIASVDARLKQLKQEEAIVRKFPALYKDWEKAVVDLEEKQKQLNEQLADTHENVLNKQEDAIDEVINYFKEFYETRRDLELEAIDELIEKEEELSQKRIEGYQEDYEEFEKNLNKRIEALDKAENERVYKRDLGNKQKDRQNIIDEISLVSMDTSAQGKQRLRQLQQELAKINDDIYEMQNQRRIERAKETLNNELEARQKEAEKLSEQEEKRLDEQLDKFEEYRKKVEREWENLIENERMWALMREQLLAGNLSEMSAQIDTFQVMIAQSASKIGESISQNLIDNLERAQQGLIDINDLLTPEQMGYNQNYGSKIITGNTIKNIPIADPLQQGYYNPNPNNIPQATGNNINTQNITISINIDKLNGTQESANYIVEEVTRGLTRKGVTM